METIKINGSSLTIEQLVKVARYAARVEIAPEAMETMKASRQLVFDLAESNTPVYGFNTGVGWNKDKRVFKEFFKQYNENLIRSHCLGVEPYASVEEVRAIMLARLNPLLLGITGIQPEIAVMYADMLNNGIHPLIPERGSVGEGDITCLSHIGLAMIGEGDVNFRGEIVSASESLKKSGLKAAQLGPKDGLAIVSSNALGAGQGVLVAYEMQKLLDLMDVTYALSLEGLNGNTSPLDKEAQKIRPFVGQGYSAARIREYLEGSYIWEADWKKPVQDPLCYRSGAHVIGAVRDALRYLEDLLLIQLNSSDDNPCIILEEKRMISCSNFEATNWAMAFEMLGLGIVQLSKMSCYRSIKLGNPEFTKLPRFLSPADNVLGFATLQKVYTSLDSEIRHLANPAPDFFSLAGDIEDHANSIPYIVQKTRKMLDNLYYIIGIELMHGAQAVDLRNDIHIGKGTKAVFEEFRREIPFYNVDRNLSVDIKKAYEIAKSGKLQKAAEEAVGR